MQYLLFCSCVSLLRTMASSSICVPAKDTQMPVNPAISTWKTYPESKYLSLLLPLPPSSKLPSSFTWTVAITSQLVSQIPHLPFTVYYPQSIQRVHWNIQCCHSSVQNLQWLPISCRVIYMVWPQLFLWLINMMTNALARSIPTALGSLRTLSPLPLRVFPLSVSWQECSLP